MIIVDGWRPVRDNRTHLHEGEGEHPMTYQPGSAAGRSRPLAAVGSLVGVLVSAVLAGDAAGEKPPAPEMPRVRVSEDGKTFVLAGSGKPFVPWGFNYLGKFEHLAEEDWDTPAGWERIETDFREMKKLGGNVVRWHLQFETFMAGPDRPKPDQLARLKKLLDLAREHRPVSRSHGPQLLPPQADPGLVRSARRGRPVEGAGPVLGGGRRDLRRAPGRLLLRPR